MTMQTDQSPSREAELILLISDSCPHRDMYGQLSKDDVTAFADAILALLTPATQPDADREAKARGALADAFAAGALAVHDAWIGGNGSSEPDFGEAASDYSHSVDLSAFADATRPQVSDAVEVLRAQAAQFRKAAEQQGKKVGPRAASFEDAADYLSALRTQPSQAIPDAQGNLQGNLAGSTDVQSGEVGFRETGGSCKAEELREAVRSLLPIGNDKLPGDRVVPIYVRMDELRALHALAAPHPIARADETRHVQQQELQEIADGAFGDGPATRGRARDAIARADDGEGGVMEHAHYIEVAANVRYWEDASVNGVEDTDGTLIPGRDGDTWKVRIELLDGIVVDWPEGTEAAIHYKVCDEGEYWLLDAAFNRIAKWRGHYVPDDFLCHGSEGFGDYIILNVGVGGGIEGYEMPTIDPARWAASEAHP